MALGSVAVALTALGRLSDSLEPQRAGLEAVVARKDWCNAARVGCELVNTLLTLGRVTAALDVAGLAVTHADLSGDDGQRADRRTNLAAVLVAIGDSGRAAALLVEAEEIHGKFQPDSAQLYSLPGYRHGDLLLACGYAAWALERGYYQLNVAECYLGEGLGLLDIGFALGSAEAASSLDAAVAGLRKSGAAHFLPQALLARAAHRRRRAASGETDLIEGIRADLAEVEDIAGEEMRLYLTDLALERARLALDVPAAFESAQAARAEAEAQTRQNFRCG